MSALSQIDTIVEWNNNGVAAVENDLQQSIFSFRTALNLIKKCVFNSEVCECESDKGHESLVDEDMNMMHQWMPTNDHKYKCDLVGTALVTDDAFFQVINLLPASHAFAKDPLATLSVMFVIAAFNLAVAYHRRGAATETDLGHECLTNGRTFYLAVLSMLQELGISGLRSSCPELTDLIIMACYNNLAQIAFILSEFTASEHHFRMLLAYVDNLYFHTNDASTSSYLEHYRMKFVRNAFLLKPPTRAAAA